MTDGSDTPAASVNSHPVRLMIDDDLARKRLTVFFRLLLVIPHGIWLVVWGIGAFFAAVVNWIATLVTARPPAALHRFLSLYVKYATQVYAYLFLAADPYPPFDGRPGYPVDVEIGPPERQSRITVAFRLVLVIPALLLAAALFGAPTVGWSRGNRTFGFNFGIAHAGAFLGWFACLAVARMPRGLRDVVAWGIGFGAQLWAYLFVLTSRYPDNDPDVVLGKLAQRDDPLTVAAKDDLRRTRLTVFFRLLLAFPHFAWLTLWGVVVFLVAIANWVATLFRGRSPRALHKFLAAYVRYTTQVYAFVALAGNPFPGFVGARGTYPVEAQIDDVGRQNRWSVGFRLILAFPALVMAGAYSTLLWTGAALAWFAALVTGKMPRRLQNAGLQALRYSAQTYGYLFLLTGAYPYSGPCQLPPLTQPVRPAPTPLAGVADRSDAVLRGRARPSQTTLASAGAPARVCSCADRGRHPVELDRARTLALERAVQSSSAARRRAPVLLELLFASQLIVFRVSGYRCAGRHRCANRRLGRVRASRPPADARVCGRTSRHRSPAGHARVWPHLAGGGALHPGRCRVGALAPHLSPGVLRCLA
jgi:Domain of unknown function (DUF4389)